MIRKRRSLVLTTESARHPFRMSLPMRTGKAIEADWLDAPQAPARRWRDILAAYVATFLVTTIFIA